MAKSKRKRSCKPAEEKPKVETNASKKQRVDEMDNDDQALLISDQKYAEDLQLQQALDMSLESFQNEMRMNKFEGTSSSSLFCEICMEEKSRNQMFDSTTKCSHAFCADCISKHIAAKIQENVSCVACPGTKCKFVLEPEACQSLLPVEVFDRWMNALCESYVEGSHKFYCPFKDCSAMLVDDGGEIVRQSECPNCRRLFCAQCKVPWHPDMSCESFQRSNVDETRMEDMVMKLAKEKRWRRCPSCRYYVERNNGCLHITCRCGFQFCYRCGATWTDVHGACT